MSHFCTFCQLEHSSNSCFHPGRQDLQAKEERIVELEKTLKTSMETSIEVCKEKQVALETSLAEAERKISVAVEALQKIENHEHRESCIAPEEDRANFCWPAIALIALSTIESLRTIEGKKEGGE